MWKFYSLYPQEFGSSRIEFLDISDVVEIGDSISLIENFNRFIKQTICVGT